METGRRLLETFGAESQLVETLEAGRRQVGTLETGSYGNEMLPEVDRLEQVWAVTVMGKRPW